LERISTTYYGNAKRAADIRTATEQELKKPFPQTLAAGFVVTLPDPIYSAMAFQGRYPYYATFLYDSVTFHLKGLNGYLARQNLAPGAIAAAESVRGIEL